MTYNVFGGTLNLAQLQFQILSHIQSYTLVFVIWQDCQYMLCPTFQFPSPYLIINHSEWHGTLLSDDFHFHEHSETWAHDCLQDMHQWFMFLK